MTLSILGGLVVTVWLLGCLFVVIGGIAKPEVCPPGWPWLVPLWPGLLIVDGWRLARAKRRHRQLLRDVWKR